MTCSLVCPCVNKLAYLHTRQSPEQPPREEVSERDFKGVSRLLEVKFQPQLGVYLELLSTSGRERNSSPIHGDTLK